MSMHPCCPDHDLPDDPARGAGLSRRDLLKCGIGGTLGLVLGPYLRFLGADDAPGAKAKRVIVLWMGGGPSQLDTFDMKPGTENGGPFKAIKTSASGIRISEHLPQIARQMEHISLIRSVTSREGNHQRARYLLHTGYPPQAGVNHPSVGAVVSREMGDPAFELPNYVSIGGRSVGSGFLGIQHAPFIVSNPAKPPENLKRPQGVDKERFARRLKLLGVLEERFGKVAREQAEGHKAVYERAVRMMQSNLAKAFDISKEPADVRRAYGDNRFGKACLMARRLAEAGCKVIEVNLNGWDTHRDNFESVKRLSGMLDPGMANLIADLKKRDMLKETLVVWMGEFGRTPKVNGNAGRDHFARAFTIAVAGGGTAGGRVIGKTSDNGMDVVDGAVKVPDLFTTFYHLLGIDTEKSYYSKAGRPINIVGEGGNVIKDLLT